MIPIIITGQEYRIREILNEFPEVDLYGLPTIETVETFRDNQQVLRTVLNWLEKHPITDRESTRSCVAIFSRSGARALFHALEYAAHNEKLSDHFKQCAHQARLGNWPFAVVSEQTRKEVLRLFSSARIAFLSDDGTGAGLARSMKTQTRSILAIHAERGREEFYTILNNSTDHPEIERVALYRTRSCIIDWDTVRALPSPAYWILGSPSSVETIMMSTGELSNPERLAWMNRTRFCALGHTTANALQSHGIHPVLIAATPDYTQCIRELMRSAYDS
ncbi:MAG: uroporphyrinogen-III synthase [Leptospiraceae bacterium]|nr:uroporphyrinogen-III synthase [Leptospiraceae bacterium]